MFRAEGGIGSASYSLPFRIVKTSKELSGHEATGCRLGGSRSRNQW